MFEIAAYKLAALTGPMVGPVAANTAGATSNLKGTWTTLWAQISGPMAEPLKYAGWFGAALLVYSIVKFVWSKRRGGARPTEIVWTTAIGAILTLPNVIIPVLLGFIDLIVNVVLALLR